MAHTPWCGPQEDKLYLQSGQFTSTLRTSQAIGTVDTNPRGISWDGTNTPWIGDQAAKLYLQSGQFSSTIKDSQLVNAIDLSTRGISFDNFNTPWAGTLADKLYLQSGQFTSTLKTSLYIGDVDVSPGGISWDGTNTPWTGADEDKLYLQSGQFTATLKTSQTIATIDGSPQGISWDGTNTPWCGFDDDKLYLQSGQFTSTLKTSQYIGDIDNSPTGICTNDYDARIGYSEQLISQTLTITQEVVETIQRSGIPNLPTSNILTFVDVAGYYTGESIPTDTIEFTQNVTVTTNNYRIVDALIFEQTARIPETYTRTTSNTFAFTQATSYLSNNYKINQQLYIEQFADLDGAFREIVQELTFTQAATVEIGFFACFPENELAFVQSVAVEYPYNLVASNTLSFEQEVSVIAPYNLTILMPMNWRYNSNGHIWYETTSFQETVDYEIVYKRTKHQQLVLIQTVNVTKEIAGAVSETASNTLTFTQTAAITHLGESTLTFTQTADVDYVKAGRNILTFSQVANYNLTSVYPASNDLILKSTVTYNLITTDVLNEYHPFIGSSTDSDAPNPPHLTPKTIVTYDNVQLFYPVDDPSTTITLRGPEFDDREQLHFSRINRETRGGTLVMFSDPMWPKNQRLLLNFVGLSETEAQNTLTLIESTVAKQIGLRDWEGQEWAGVILTPDKPITRNHNCNLAIDIEFEGVPVHRRVIADSLETLSDFVKVLKYQRPLTSILTLSDIFGRTVIYDRPMTDTLTLIDEFAKLMVYLRLMTDTLTLSDGNSYLRICPRSPSNTLTLSDELVKLLIYTRPMTGTLILDDTIDLAYSNNHTPWAGTVSDKLYLQSGQFTSTLKTSKHIAAIEAAIMDVSWDGTNTPWIGKEGHKFYLQSGQFTTTLKTSALTILETGEGGISWDGTNTPWCGGSHDKLYLQSGQFTSTLRTSQYVGDVDTVPEGISWDGTNTPWTGSQADKLYLQSGQFTSTVGTSQSVSGVDSAARGISWDGTNTPWAGSTDSKLYLQSGQFTSTLKTSEDVTTLDAYPAGICTNQIFKRVP